MSNTIPNNPVQTVVINDFSPGIIRYTVGEEPVYYSPVLPVGSASFAVRCRNQPGVGLVPFYAYTSPFHFTGPPGTAPDGSAIATQVLTGVGCLGGLSSGNVTDIPDQMLPQDDMLVVNITVASAGGGFFNYGWRAFYYNAPWGAAEQLWAGVHTILPSGCSFDQTTQWEVGSTAAGGSLAPPPPTGAVPAPVPPATVPPPPGTAASYDFNGLRQLWQSVGGSTAIVATTTGLSYHLDSVMAAIALAESSGVTANINPVDNNGTQTSWGLWQISDGTHLDPARNLPQSELDRPPPSTRNSLDPVTNAKEALDKYNQSGFQPWGTYTSGAYKAHLPPAPGPVGASAPLAGIAPVAAPAMAVAQILGRALNNQSNTITGLTDGTPAGWYIRDGWPPYNQQHFWLNSSTFWDGTTGPPSGWRMDCSGFVSQAWGYPAPGFIVGNGSNGAAPGILSDPAGWGFAHQALPAVWASVEAGDAITFDDHMLLVVAVHPGPTFDIVEEYDTALGTRYIANMTESQLAAHGPSSAPNALYMVRRPAVTGAGTPTPSPGPPFPPPPPTPPAPTPAGPGSPFTYPTSMLVCQPATDTNVYYTPTQRSGAAFNTWTFTPALIPANILAAFCTSNRIGVILPIVYPVGGLANLIEQGDDRLAYTDPPTEVNPPAAYNPAVYNYYTLENSSGFGAWGSVSTGELVMIRRGQGAVTVAGDAAFPTFVTKLPAVHGTGQIMQRMTQCHAGTLYVTETDGVYAWNGGNTSQKISQQIPDQAVIRQEFEPGPTSIFVFGIGLVGVRTWHDVLNNYVFFPNNWVFDSTQNGWWQCEDLATIRTGGWAASGAGTRYMYGVAAMPVNDTFPVYQFDATTLANSYKWVSNPLPSTTETLTTVIRVELVASNPTTTEATVRITPTIPAGNVSRFFNNPQTIEFTIPPQTSGYTTFLPLGFTEYNITLDVEAANSDAANPAPAIHALHVDMIEAQTTGINS